MKSECEIYEMLRPFRLKWKNIGVSDLVCAVMLVEEKPERIHALHKEVYMVIAAERCCTWRAIETSVRRVREEAWNHNRRHMETLVGYPLDSCPTAAEFIYICANYVPKRGAEDIK